MSIGELARQFDLAPHVLRHWEAMGLLTPAARVNGRRRYTADDAVRIAVIVRCKEAGLSLEQVGDVLAAPSRADRNATLRRHHDDLVQRIQRLQHSQQMIEHALECEAEDYTRCPAFRRILAQRLTEPAPSTS